MISTKELIKSHFRMPFLNFRQQGYYKFTPIEMEVIFDTFAKEFKDKIIAEYDKDIHKRENIVNCERPEIK